MKPVVLKKWIPAAAVPVAIAAVALGSSFAASAQVDLPDKTPEEVLAMVAASDVDSFSGHVLATSDLGIPQLPDVGDGEGFGPPGADPGSAPGTDADPTDSSEEPSGSPDSADAGMTGLLNMLSGTHEARVYVDGPDKARFQKLDRMRQEDVVLNGTDVWQYSSEENTAVHTTLPMAPSEAKAALEDAKESWGGRGGKTMPTPEELADRFLEMADPGTEVTVEEGSVAGRDVYNLVMTPATDDTLVAGVTIGVDAETGAPLAVTVEAVDQEEPAISVAFTKFTPEAPDAGIFDFEPPADATVEERELPDHDDWDKGGWDKGDLGTWGDSRKGDDAAKGPRSDRGTAEWREAHRERMSGDAATRHGGLDGTGWDAVVAIPAEKVPDELQDSELLNGLAAPVDGGRLLHTSLVNVLIADDGRVFVGSVPLERLQAAADAG